MKTILDSKNWYHGILEDNNAFYQKSFNTQFKQCLEYSEDKEALKDLLIHIMENKAFKIEKIRVVKSPWHDNMKAVHYSITLGTYTYDFWGSHAEAIAIENRNLKQIKENEDCMLYSIMCDIGSSYYCEPLFEDFCNDFGYDEDSRKAFDTWQKCLKHSGRLNAVLRLTDKQFEALPC